MEGRTTYQLRTAGFQVTNAYRVYWDEGAIEPGSSGSGLFLDNSVYLIGVASATNDRCGSPSSWGSFRDFWPKVERWLGPTSATLVSIPSSTPAHVDTDAVDYFRVEVRYRGKLWVRTKGHTDTVGTLFSQYEQIAYDDDNGDDQNFQIVADVVPGIYHLEVRASQKTPADPTHWKSSWMITVTHQRPPLKFRSLHQL